MFGFGPPIDFWEGNGNGGTSVAVEPDYDPADVIVTNTAAPRTRTVAELEARIRAAGGSLIVDGNASDYIVATNNPGRFKIESAGGNSYRISLGSGNALLAGVGSYLPFILLGVVVLAVVKR